MSFARGVQLQYKADILSRQFESAFFLQARFFLYILQLFLLECMHRRISWLVMIGMRVTQFIEVLS